MKSSSLKMNVSGRERRLLILTLIAGIGGLLFVYIIEPRMKDWRSLLKRLQQTESKYLERSVLLENEDIIRKRHKYVAKSFQTEGSATTDALGLYSFLSSLADSSFAIKDIRPLSNKRKSGEFRAVLLAQSTPDGLERFFRKIIDCQQALAIEKFMFAIPREGEPINITVTLCKTVKKIK